MSPSFRSLLVALFLFTVGCGVDGESVSAVGDETVADVDAVEVDSSLLVGSSWSLRSGGGPEGEVALVDGWPITLTFDERTLGGTAACNGYGASYTIEGSQLLVDGFGKEEQGCAPLVQESESTYMAALEDVDVIDVDGDQLALSGPSTELIFGRNSSVDTGELIATLWLLEATIRDGVATAVEGDPATLRLNPDGSLTGGTGCRSLAGRYVVFGNEVQFPEFSADGDCPSVMYDQDGKVVGVLGDGFVPVIEDGVLTLSSAGKEGLRYRAITDEDATGLVGSPVSSDADLLGGVEWILVAGYGPDGPLFDAATLRADGTITFVLAAGNYSGTAFCNSYSGAADVGNGRLSLGGPAVGEESCGDDLDRAAAAYLEALPLMNEFGLEADMARWVVNGSQVELWFERAG